MNFENLTVRFYVIYVLNTHVKFYFKLNVIYYSINKLIFFIHHFILQNFEI